MLLWFVIISGKLIRNGQQIKGTKSSSAQTSTRNLYKRDSQSACYSQTCKSALMNLLKSVTDLKTSWQNSVCAQMMHLMINLRLQLFAKSKIEQKKGHANKRQTKLLKKQKIPANNLVLKLHKSRRLKQWSSVKNWILGMKRWNVKRKQDKISKMIKTDAKVGTSERQKKVTRPMRDIPLLKL